LILYFICYEEYLTFHTTFYFIFEEKQWGQKREVPDGGPKGEGGSCFVPTQNNWYPKRYTALQSLTRAFLLDPFSPNSDKHLISPHY